MTLLPPEAQLFFLAIKPRDDGDTAPLAALANSDINWQLLAHIAEREKMLSVMWYGLRGRVDAMPRDLEGAVRRRTAVIEFRMAATRATLEQIVTQLAAEGIPSLLLKGAALAHSVYPSFARRPMSDLDVLVAPEQALHAWTRMRVLGWGFEQDGGADFHAAYHHLKPLVDPAGGRIVLEIHRSMMPYPGPFAISESDVWHDATEVRVGSSRAYVPSDLHQLLHLCVHFAWSHSLVHGIGRAVRDVATLAATRDIDWDAFIPLARRTHAATSAYWTLALSRKLVNAAVPVEVLTALRPSQPRLVTKALERAYIVSAVFDLCPSVQLAELLWSAGIRPRHSGHGADRPWHVTERYKEVFREGSTPPLMTRARTHARDLAAWIRFARIISGRGSLLHRTTAQ